MDAKTIQIFLPEGNPRGIRIADITSRIVQLLEIPRATLGLAGKRQELSRVGVYFLIGDEDETDARVVYVGEAEDCLTRLKQHNQQKEFWNSALVAVSKTQSFTKTHVKYLEWYCHERIATAKRYGLKNATIPTRPFTSESMMADLEDNFQTLQVLVSTLGFPLFDELKPKSKRSLIYCRGRNVEAKGEWTEEGLVVFEGSTASAEEAPSAAGTWVPRIRNELRESGTLVPEGDKLRFTRSHVFSSPSAAAVAVLGRNANGWIEWVFEGGHPLDEVRKSEATTEADK